MKSSFEMQLLHKKSPGVSQIAHLVGQIVSLAISVMLFKTPITQILRHCRYGIIENRFLVFVVERGNANSCRYKACGSVMSLESMADAVKRTHVRRSGPLSRELFWSMAYSRSKTHRPIELINWLLRKQFYNSLVGCWRAGERLMYRAQAKAQCASVGAKTRSSKRAFCLK